MWISFMQEFLRGQDEQSFPQDRNRNIFAKETAFEASDSTTDEVETTKAKKKRSSRKVSDSKPRVSKRKIVRRSATTSSDSTKSNSSSGSSSTRVTPRRRSNSVVPEQLF
jgi:hypothetical protein